MIRKTEKYYTKRVCTNKSSIKGFNNYGSQSIKKTTYWLFWIVPIFSKREIIGGSYEYKR